MLCNESATVSVILDYSPVFLWECPENQSFKKGRGCTKISVLGWFGDVPGQNQGHFWGWVSNLLASGVQRLASM